MSTMWESGSGLQVAAEVRQDLSVLQIGCKFKQTNEQTNKQTNKQTNRQTCGSGLQVAAEVRQDLWALIRIHLRLADRL